MSQKARPLPPQDLKLPLHPMSSIQNRAWGHREAHISVTPTLAFWAHSLECGGRYMQKSRSHTGMGPQKSRISREKGQRHEISEGYRWGFSWDRGTMYKLKRGIKGQRYKLGRMQLLKV